MQDFYSVVIDKNADVPLYIQIGDAIGTLVEQGALLPNAKLPAIRDMAKCLKVNNATIISAYKYLENKRIVYSRVGSGTYVSPLCAAQVQSVIEAPYRAPLPFVKSGEGIAFTDTSLPEWLFPVDEFRQVIDSLLAREQGGAFAHVGGAGYLALRESICSFLERYHIRTKPEYVQIISGAQQGIDIVSKAMLHYGDTVFVESPTFTGAAAAFLSRGARLVEVPMQSDGMDIKRLEDLMKLYRPRFLYLMAYFQTPTGVSYSLEKKRQILKLAQQYDAYIIEDDTLYDFNYTKNPIVPFKALDYKERVIYIKSFSKILMPGLRMGFVIIPKKRVQDFLAAKYATDLSTSGFIQKAVHFYLQQGTWQEHIEKVCQYSQKQYEMALRFFEQYISGRASMQPPGGGISLWLTLKDGVNSEALCQTLAQKGVFISPQEQFMIQPQAGRHIRLCFANMSEEQMEEGFCILSENL